MKKILLRKDYKTMVVPVESAVGLYLAQNATIKWNEKFIDEDTKEEVNIERSEIVAGCGEMVTEKMVAELKEIHIPDVVVSDIPHRAKELLRFGRLVHVKVTLRNNLRESAVLIVRCDSLRGAQDLAADYAEGAANDIFKTEGVYSVYILKTEIIDNIHFIGRTKEDIEKEEAALVADQEAPVKEPFKVKASFIDVAEYEPENPKSKAGIHNKEMFVVWAYDVVTAKNIVFDYLKHKFDTVWNDRETLRVIGATQFYAHTYVPAEYCNEYIADEKLHLTVEE